MKLFSIRDSKSETYLPPRAYHTKGEAIRAIQIEAKNPDSMLCKFPLDYSLHVSGSFDNRTGAITILTPENVGIVADLLTLA